MLANEHRRPPGERTAADWLYAGVILAFLAETVASMLPLDALYPM
jgi:hypothetical protein